MDSLVNMGRSFVPGMEIILGEEPVAITIFFPLKTFPETFI